MATTWLATKHFTCEGVEYGIGDPVPMQDFSAKVQQHLVTYKHVREANPHEALSKAAAEGKPPKKAKSKKKALAKAGR